MSPQKDTKNFDGHVRISAREKALMDNLGIGFTRVFRVGMDTLKLWIQGDPSSSCVYLYSIGNHTAPHESGSLPPSAPPAHGCPCPACPIRAGFAGRAACVGQKENHIAWPVVPAPKEILVPAGPAAIEPADQS